MWRKPRWLATHIRGGRWAFHGRFARCAGVRVWCRPGPVVRCLEYRFSQGDTWLNEDYLQPQTSLSTSAEAETIPEPS